MTIEIIGQVDPNRVYCGGSFTKFVTTFVTLSLLATKYNLNDIIDNDDFLDQICVNQSSKDFLRLFQKIIGSKFSIHDLCTFYTGLPYTFDVSSSEIESVDLGNLYKHHSILYENEFLKRCEENITLVYPDKSKFHYSEISIIFLGYLIEKIYNTTFEELYEKFVINKLQLKNSCFSRVRTNNVFCEDLSDKYDYPAIAILDHGYFCYSNGYYTTLHDAKILLEYMLDTPELHFMVDLKNARPASGRLLNGLTIEIRRVDDDIIYGYEGLSFSGCNIWAYSTKHKKGYITYTNSEEDAYDIIYGEFGYKDFDKVPDEMEKMYFNFLSNYPFEILEKKIPVEYRGDYQRVRINEKILNKIFSVGDNFIKIRNPDEIKYEVVLVNNVYCIRDKDHLHGSKVGFCTARSGKKYMYFEGNLYKKINNPSTLSYLC